MFKYQAIKSYCRKLLTEAELGGRRQSGYDKRKKCATPHHKITEMHLKLDRLRV